MANNPKISPNVLSDGVKWLTNPSFCIESGTLTTIAATAQTLNDAMMQPLKIVAGEFIPVLDGDEANVTHFLLERGEIVMAADETILKVDVLANGPALINYAAIPALDPAGDPYDIAAIQTAIEALDIEIKPLLVPTDEEEQTT